MGSICPTTKRQTISINYPSKKSKASKLGTKSLPSISIPNNSKLSTFASHVQMPQLRKPKGKRLIYFQYKISKDSWVSIYEYLSNKDLSQIANCSRLFRELSTNLRLFKKFLLTQQKNTLYIPNVGGPTPKSNGELYNLSTKSMVSDVNTNIMLSPNKKLDMEISNSFNNDDINFFQLSEERYSSNSITISKVRSALQCNGDVLHRSKTDAIKNLRPHTLSLSYVDYFSKKKLLLSKVHSSCKVVNVPHLKAYQSNDNTPSFKDEQTRKNAGLGDVISMHMTPVIIHKQNLLSGSS